MTLVLVHGNPETAAVWDPLVRELGALGRDDVVRLSPPGFGAPVPDGFGATVGEYRAWLAARLEEIGTPVDLVGHDWGGGHVVGVAMTRPDLLRSWASDVLGLFEPEYVWHDLAQAWQTPEVGEASVAEMLGGTDADRVERMTAFGVTPEVAAAMAPEQDETMQRCILALYRSAAQPVMADLGVDLPRASARPGLALVATDDPFVGSGGLPRAGAQRAGARVATLEGCGHWWMCQDPAQGARVLDDFLRSVAEP